jgi:dienelactone hydrolase
MTYNTRHSTLGINLPNLLSRYLAAMGMVVLLSGFTVIEVEFNSIDVPPSKFKIRLAKQKGLPAPEGIPGLPVKATLTKPEGKGPFPAIVMFPNGGGWPDTPRHWRKRLNTWGYATLEVGAENEVTNTMLPSSVAIGALKYLQEVPYVDSDRVAVMGWSMGAETALWAIDALGWAGKHRDRFVAAVAIYPACHLLNVGQFFSPALIISAELDGIARPSSCERLVKSVPSGLNVPILKIIPGAYHWFDLPHRPAITYDMTYSQTYDMTYEYNAKATEAAVNHVRSFLEANF